MMLVPKILSVGALHTVKMLLSNTAVPIFGVSHERAIRTRYRSSHIERDHTERFSRTDTCGGFAGRRLGVCVVAGAMA